MAKESAEEKLLKMMKKSGAPAAAAPAKTAAPAAQNKFKLVFTVGMLNQVLLLAIIACIAGLAFEMQQGVSLLNKSVNVNDDVKTPSHIADIALPASKDEAYYLEALNSRNIFRPFETQDAQKAPEAQNLAKRMSKYKLVGVAWLDLPESASIMIEDTTNSATRFLKQGEQLEGVTLKTIYTDRAVFGYENEETTIKL